MTFLSSGFSFSTEALKCFWLKQGFYLDRTQCVVVACWPGLQLGWAPDLLAGVTEETKVSST